MSHSRETTSRLAAQITETFTARGQTYGPPEENFANIAAFWRVWIKARHGVELPLDAHDVGQMSSLIKKARLACSPKHEDSALDDATYTMLGHGCAAGEVDDGRQFQTDECREAWKAFKAAEANGAFVPVSVVHSTVPGGGDVGLDPDFCEHRMPRRQFCGMCEGYQG